MSSPLVDAVVAAAAGAPEAGDRLIEAVLATESIVFETVPDPAGGPEGESGPELRIVEVDDATFLLAHADLDEARRRQPSTTFAGVPTRDALRMIAGSGQHGLLVDADLDGGSWAAIPAATVASMAGATTAGDVSDDG